MLIVSCGNSHKKHKGETYATTDRPGYSTGNGYTYVGTSSSFSSYNSAETVSWSPTQDNVSNFDAVPEAVAESMTEASGDAVGGTEATEGADGSMSESDGSSEGGSDSSSGGDFGGGDSGGGDGGGGGE